MAAVAEIAWKTYPPEKLLVERFGITTGFHAGQREIIELLMQGRRVLAIQHTGWGKSLCYQMVSLYYPHLTVVFSPLKALMRDQCRRCNDLYRIPAAIVSSDFSAEENRATLALAVRGEIKILFIAPERLENADWQAAVRRMRISMVVIDEAHCISIWGHDFRPHYRRIVRLLALLPANMPVLALTATANRRVEEDILQQIGGDAEVLRGPMRRPNLYLHVERRVGDQEKLGYLAQVLPNAPGTGIIYTATKADAEMVATFLQGQGIAAEYYHAGREDGLRQEIEQKLMANRYRVVCSTNALGMGIDKRDIRFVIHYQFPASPIHYYQEVGRAGRDGKPSWCILLYDSDDLAIQEHFMRTAMPESQYYEAVLALLRASPQGVSMNDLLWETGYAEKDLRVILVDLEEQHFIAYNARTLLYSDLGRGGELNFSAREAVREQKLGELAAMQAYIHTDGCYMRALAAYLGDQAGEDCGVCGHCHREHFPFVLPSERMQLAAIHFLDEDFMPHIERCVIEKRLIHEAGWSLSYPGRSRIGKLVRASKYEEAGPFPLGLVYRAVEVIRARYPLHLIDGVASMPPTKSGMLVEMFAQQVAALLGITCLPALAKLRLTQEQKLLHNRLQKAENVKGAFGVRAPEMIAGRALLLIDDIYDSGYMLREAARTLMQAGARAVYPFTITRTLHADDQ